MTTLLDVLRRTEAWLRSRGVPSPRLDTEVLLGHVLGVPRLQLYLMYDRPLTEPELDALRPLVRRRGAREPLAWITGEKGFHHLDLQVVPGVLVPRPDTETLVEAAGAWIDEGHTDDVPVYVADVGAGTGAVGLALAAPRPWLRLYAVDLSDEALACTRANVATLGLADRVGVLKGSLLDPVPAARPVDWVVSNPPYIPSGEIDGLEPEVAVHEPRLALDGGADGLDVIRPLVAQARRRARRGLLLEVGHDQAEVVAALLARAGFTDVRTWDDLGGHRRVVGGRQPGPAGASALSTSP
ncbi:MAG: peptide chain release factor N(5)-glutamine methyltransferase [Alphaproteobacteria bacterium]|nr:peptide chain release factor N(5)-glutamine methyltransferase [Alphaproteobacteria bacterium]